MGSARDFENGDSDYVAMGNLDLTADTDMSVLIWHYAESHPETAEDERLISKANGAISPAHWWTLSTVLADTDLRLLLKTGGTTTAYRPNLTLGDNVWIHGAAAYTGSSVQVYSDGVEEFDGSASGNINTDGSVAVSIGRNGSEDAKYWDGRLAHAIVSNTGFDGGMVNEIMHNPMAAGLGSNLFWCPLWDVGTNPTIQDLSGNGNDGTNNGTAEWGDDGPPVGLYYE